MDDVATLMMDDHSEIANIPSNYARIIGRELGLNIRDIPSLLQFSQLSAEQFMQDDTLLSSRQLIQILQNSLSLSKTPDFYLNLGKRLTPTTHGLMGFLVNNSPNLLMALNAFKTFLPTRISFAHVSLEFTADTVICSLDFTIPISSAVNRMLNEVCVVVLYECAEFIIGRPLHEARAYFSHAEPDYKHLYKHYLPSPFSFSADQIQVEIPLSVCEIANASSNHENYLLAMRQCEILLQELTPTQENIVFKIQKMMLSQPFNELNEEKIAAALFINKRTLARKLAQDQTSFRQLSDEIKSRQAAHYLCKTELSVEAIASILNYHDSANFRRAFKRWFNMTPSEYRQSNGQLSGKVKGR